MDLWNWMVKEALLYMLYLYYVHILYTYKGEVDLWNWSVREVLLHMLYILYMLLYMLYILYIYYIGHCQKRKFSMGFLLPRIHAALPPRILVFLELHNLYEGIQAAVCSVSASQIPVSTQ